MNEKQNNKVFISGTIVGEKTLSHELFGEKFYETKITVKRLSGNEDTLPITISERLIGKENIEAGSTISAFGQLRTYNKFVDGKSRLFLTIFIKELVETDSCKNPNSIVLNGYLCKPPVFRVTPFNREICDMHLAVNRDYNKSDYIPCIAWGRTARFVKDIAVGERIAIFGRIQSREYFKVLESGETKTMTAYEVSVSRLCAYNNVDDFFGRYGYEDLKKGA